MRTRNIKNFIFLGLALVFLICAGFINSRNSKPEIKITKQDSALNFNSNFIKIFNAGQSRLLSDIFWISTLIESDIDHYAGKDLNSWLYLRFKTISILDPKFLANYQFGGKYLSIVKDDIYGAKEIFEKGLSHYPEDFYLLFDAGFLYFYEFQNYKKAYELYSKIKDHPQTPYFIKTLIPKLKLESGDSIIFAKKYLENLLAVEKDPVLIEKIKMDIYAIQAEIDLNCLNSNKDRCNQKDYFGYPYLYRSGKYKAQIEFKKYKLNKKSRE